MSFLVVGWVWDGGLGFRFLISMLGLGDFLYIWALFGWAFVYLHDLSLTDAPMLTNGHNQIYTNLVETVFNWSLCRKAQSISLELVLA